jgi:hypothetical protein
MINFVYPGEGIPYSNIIDAIVNPILEHLPEGRKTLEPGVGLNVGFFTEKGLLNGCSAFIPHGIADKNYRTAERVGQYEHVICSGPLWRDLYIRQGMDQGRIFIGGYSKLDPIFKGMVKKSKDIRVLWAPTHSAFDSGAKPATSSSPGFAEYLGEIEGVEVALHPADKPDETPTIQKLVDARVVIADHGSILYEALALGKPVVIPDWIVREGIISKFPGSFECFIFENDFCYHATDIKHLNELINVALEEGIDRRTKDFIDGIFPPELRGNSGEATAQILRKIKGGCYV